MIMLGANIAVFQSRRILLTKREDFEVWCLPGGVVEVGESIAEAAIREAREETGLSVELLRLVGVYSTVPGVYGADWHAAVFSARPNGGILSPQASEVLDLRFFDPDDLPDGLLWWHRQRIADACQGLGGSACWRQESKRAERASSRQELYALRDRSELPRSEFYRRYVERARLDETIEVSGVPAAQQGSYRRSCETED
jgi:8-oxo-dGTP pyrophosphatase MutT (NUDIX family)